MGRRVRRRAAAGDAVLSRSGRRRSPWAPRRAALAVERDGARLGRALVRRALGGRAAPRTDGRAASSSGGHSAPRAGPHARRAARAKRPEPHVPPVSLTHDDVQPGGFARHAFGPRASRLQERRGASVDVPRACRHAPTCSPEPLLRRGASEVPWAGRRARRQGRRANASRHRGHHDERGHHDSRGLVRARA